MTLPTVIQNFIQQNHVLSLAVSNQQQLCCASCFYVLHPSADALVILTSSNSVHGKVMTLNPSVAGTISGQPLAFKEIEGIQFQAQVLNKTTSTEARSLKKYYYQKFPLARVIPSEIWLLSFTSVKHTCNRERFGKKTFWQVSDS